METRSFVFYQDEPQEEYCVSSIKQDFTVWGG